jgi:hypothetical protein
MQATDAATARRAPSVFPTRDRAESARSAIAASLTQSPTRTESFTPIKPNGLTYNGGNVMLGTPSVYVIWYGTWADSSKSFVREFLHNLGGSSWYSTMTTYYDSLGRTVSS